MLMSGVVALVLVGMGLPDLLPSGWTPYARIVLAAVLLAVGAWLVLRSRRRKKLAGMRARFVEPVLEIVGLVMVTVAVIEAVLGARGLT